MGNTDGQLISYANLSRIENSMASLSSNMASVATQSNAIQSRVESTYSALQQLCKDFRQMVTEQRHASALQRALTEIVRIRQELERNFANHKKARDSMIGILQASDLSIVKESTISQCSEQLMLACPRYWLAPCIVAITAWMANDEELAKRAIAEAMKRNDENTSLVMALICRRAGRVEPSFQWLRRYFAKQDPHNTKESILVLLDAYSNGIFGEDRKNICGDSVDKWMRTLYKTPGFRENQERNWMTRFHSFRANNIGSVALSENGICPEYSKIENSIASIRGKARIFHFFDMIIHARIDKKALIEEVDDNLETLINEYEEEEAPLRKEERRMTLIKEFKGNEERADEVMRLEQKVDKDVNLADRLSNAMMNSKTKPSIKRTAAMMLSDVIKDTYKKYMINAVDSYPNEITLNIAGVSVKTKNGENRDELKSTLKQKLEEARDKKIAKKSGKVINIAVFSVAAVLVILSIILFAIGNTVGGIVTIVLGAVIGIVGLVLLLNVKAIKKTIMLEFAQLIDKSIKLLDDALDERIKYSKEIAVFSSNKENLALKLIGMNEKKEAA